MIPLRFIYCHIVLTVISMVVPTHNKKIRKCVDKLKDITIDEKI